MSAPGEGRGSGAGSARGARIDFLSGSLWDKILLFALPITATNILQQIFNTADIAVLGRLVGKESLAAVGCTGPIVTLFITLFSGMAVGANVVIARALGAGDAERARKAVHSSVVIALLSGLLVTLLGELMTRPLLELVGTPAELISLAARYLQIYFAGSVFLMLYNFEAAILRSAGETRKPVLVLLGSGILNVALNLFFVLALDMDVEGVALATLISNVLSAALLLAVLLRYPGVIRVELSRLRLTGECARAILFTGVPAAAQGILFNIANIVIQSGINSLGADAVAGSTVGMNVEIYAYYIVNGLSQACVTFNSQNYGAGNLRRCADSTRWCILLGAAITAVVSLLMVSLRRPLARLFTQDEAVVAFAAARIAIIAGFELLNMVIEVLSGALRGVGHSLLPTALCVVFICAVRILWLLTVFPLRRSFVWLFAVYPVSWALASASLAVAYFAVKRRLNAAAAGGV